MNPPNPPLIESSVGLPKFEPHSRPLTPQGAKGVNAKLNLIALVAHLGN